MTSAVVWKWRHDVAYYDFPTREHQVKILNAKICANFAQNRLNRNIVKIRLNLILG